MTEKLSTPRHIAVIDLGKTNAKLALVDAETLTEITVEKRPNTVVTGGTYPSFDLDGHWAFFCKHLTAFQASHGIDAISVTTHGAAAVLLDAEGALALPMLDYEHDLSRWAAEYDRLRPPFTETGSPRLPLGLNLGAQLHWLAQECPDDWARVAHVVTYPQYWVYLLTGVFGTDVTSLGCHTDLWDPHRGQVSSLVARLGLTERLAPSHRSMDRLGGVTAEVAAATGLRPGTPVVCGIHDSNASLYPHVLARRGRGPFAVVSTGTWVVAMAVEAAPVTLDPAKDCLINVNALGDPVPSARFMGGREYELVRQGCETRPTPQDRAQVLVEGLMLLPSIEPGSGPYPDRVGGWTATPTDGARMVALSWYLALMTAECLAQIGARGPVIVEGPFAANPDFVEMLAALRPDGVEVARSATGTSVGAALLFGATQTPVITEPVRTADPALLQAYAADWRARVSAPQAETVAKTAS